MNNWKYKAERQINPNRRFKAKNVDGTEKTYTYDDFTEEPSAKMIKQKFYDDTQKVCHKVTILEG